MFSCTSFASFFGRKFFAYLSRTQHSLSKFALIACLLVALPLSLAPSTAHAQSYVPVYDQDVETAVKDFHDDFNTYVNDLFERWDNTFGKDTPDGTTDSLRDLISGTNPKMPGGENECKKGDNLNGFLNAPATNPAFAYGKDSTDPKDPSDPWGPWKYAFESSTAAGGDLPISIPGGDGEFVQVNYSKSLRCLLQEVVEWQKLQLSLQINTLLKNYIADAQSAQLSKQLQGKLAAANFNFSKGGEEVNNDGVQSNGPIFSADSNQDTRNIQNRVTEQYTDQAMAPTDTADPQGGFNNCTTYKGDITAAVVNQNRDQTENPADFTKEVTGCTLSGVIPENQVGDFFENYNTGTNILSGNDTYLAMLDDPANSPLGALTLNREVLAAREEKAQKLEEDRNKSSNFKPTVVCSGEDSDPHCVNTSVINPSGSNEGNINHQQDILSDNVNTNQLDSQSGTSSAAQTTIMQTDTGLAGAPILPLETAGTAVNSLIQEFYDTINVGYFGTQGSTREWAQATMLMIYDEMKFDPTKSEVITTNNTAPVDTGY